MSILSPARKVERDGSCLRESARYSWRRARRRKRKMAERPMMNSKRPPIADPAMRAGRVEAREEVEPFREVATGVTT